MKSPIIALLAICVIVAAGVILAYGRINSTQLSNIEVLVRGVPKGYNATLYSVQPHAGGGYSVGQELGSLSGDYSVMAIPSLKAQSYIGASLISLNNDTELIPSNRFQQVTTNGQLIEFDYQRNYYLVTGTWWRGTISGTGGQVETQPGWYASGSSVEVSALAEQGWMFSYWIFRSTLSSAPSDNAGFSTASSTTTLSMDGPKSVTAVFVPIWHLLSINSALGARVFVVNLVAGQKISLTTSNTVAVGSAIVAAGANNVSLDISSAVQPFSGIFAVTAPDSLTPIYTSPLISGISSGSVFEY